MGKIVHPMNVLKTLDQFERFVGRMTLADIDMLGGLLKNKKIVMRPNNRGTLEIVANTAMGAVLIGGIAYIASGGNPLIAAAGAAVGAGIGYWITCYAISVVPTGERDSNGVPLWAVEIIPV